MRIALLCLLAALAGCFKRAEEPAAPVERVQEGAKPKEATPTGAIEGSIVLAEGATLPSAEDLARLSGLLEMEPRPPCTPVSAEASAPVKRDPATSGLEGVHVALTGMKESVPTAPVTREVRIENCRLTPGLVAARVGDTLRITNASTAPYLPSFEGDSFSEAVLAGATRTIVLRTARAGLLACRLGMSCGQTEVLVTKHPLFAVTGAAGRFRIEAVPLDRPLTVHAWHPLFEEARQAVTLSREARTASVKLVLKPLEPAPAPKQDAEPKAGGRRVVVH